MEEWELRERGAMCEKRQGRERREKRDIREEMSEERIQRQFREKN